MAIKFLDGEILDCKYGEDFLENFMTNVEFMGELALDYKEETIEDKFVLLKDLKDIIEVRDRDKGVIYPMESFRKSAPNFDKDGMAMIQIYRKLDNKLNGLYKKVEDKDRTYHIMITVTVLTMPVEYQKHWPYATIDETVKAIEELGIDPFVESILDVFMVTDSN